MIVKKTVIRKDDGKGRGREIVMINTRRKRETKLEGGCSREVLKERGGG